MTDKLQDSSSFSVLRFTTHIHAARGSKMVQVSWVIEWDARTTVEKKVITSKMINDDNRASNKATRMKYKDDYRSRSLHFPAGALFPWHATIMSSIIPVSASARAGHRQGFSGWNSRHNVSWYIHSLSVRFFPCTILITEPDTRARAIVLLLISAEIMIRLSGFQLLLISAWEDGAHFWRWKLELGNGTGQCGHVLIVITWN